MTESFRVDRHVDTKVPMRDGVQLSADLFLPRGAGPRPTVLMRTPYSNSLEATIEKGQRLADGGYNCVIMDCRGRWDSEGEYVPFLNEGVDGFDTQEWIGQQPWSDGTIGTAGASYLGTTQWRPAPLGSSYLKCIVPRVICTDYYSGLLYPGGALQLNVAMTWGMRTHGRTGQDIEFHNWTQAFRHLPIRDIDQSGGRDLPFWRDWIDHPSYDDYWSPMDDEQRWDQIKVPALNMGGWFDLYANQTFTNFNGLRLHGGSELARQSQLIIGPWPHALSMSTRTGDIDFGQQSLYDLEALELRWFDRWLRGIDNGIERESPLRLFIMGANRWQDEDEWPLARTDWQRWFLHSEGQANSVIGDGRLSLESPVAEAADQFVYDPDYPVQTLGGNNCCSPHVVPWGPHDQRPAEMRGDVLCYTSDPLAGDLQVIGPIEVVLFAATDGLDTDWTAKLVDVFPNGYAMNLCDGIVRARYRESCETPSLLEAGTIYEYRIEVGVTGNVFQVGHRLRLEISSSNFPRFDRNPNTGNTYGVDAQLRVAHQTVHHSADHPSHVRIPVIPA
ncbi:MAG: CocE/NonD family hydrolase [Candidatus Latescibacterota bacterium]|nr:CocE/NonD family hydrolase [Candidatus Latescibacterota bacterium]MED5414334.1 CocE/NonD family hydrolase [Candidatus Latescibacterota bacterium]MEE3043388.1 CocE/NonD family hydrolase [Candidatus Latescibacterota bacterium]